MNLSKRGQLFFGNAAPGVWVARFVRRDAVKELYLVEPITQSELYQDLEEQVFSTLGEGETLVLNFGWVESFGSPFYRLLLKTREELTNRKGRLLLCRLSPLIVECFDILQGHRTFEITSTEEGAIRAAARS
jgi:anti-anti-sigma regulatory factor